MGRGAEAVHEGRDVWGRAYAQMSLGNLAARSVLIDATEGWSAGGKLPSPRSDLLVSVRTPPRMLQFIGQTQGVVRNHTRPTLWPRGVHGTTVRAYAGALPAVPGAPTETRKCFGLHISRSPSRELRSRIGSVYLGLQPVQRPNCHRPTGVRQNAFRPKSSHPGVPSNNPTNPSAVVPNHIPCLNPVGWRFRDHCATGVRLSRSAPARAPWR
jgi:hypothetical protein